MKKLNKLYYSLLFVLLLPMVVNADVAVPSSPAEEVLSNGTLVAIIVAVVAFIIAFATVFMVNKSKKDNDNYKEKKN